MTRLIDRIVTEGESQPSPLQAIPANEDELSEAIEEAAEDLLDPLFIEEVAIQRYAKGTIWGGRFKPHRGAAAAPVKALLKALKERHGAPVKRGMASVGVQPSDVGSRAAEKAQAAVSARAPGLPPRSFEAAAEDVRSLASKVADEHHASLVLGELKINPDGFDTSGMRYADGSVEIGPEAEVSLREFAAYVSRGETPPDDVSASAYLAQRTMIHESMHSVNPMDQGEYSTTPWAMAMEEALTEEMAHDLAVRQLRAHGGHAALDWAGRANAWVLEDDCDSEFRWSGHPLPPLATLDRAGRVIYCGTFSKTLAPALRLGFAVVPAPLVPAFVRALALTGRGIDTFNQATLAEFMRQGLLAPHIRRMRTEYARRRDALLTALARHAPSIRPIDAPGGLHMVGRLADGADEAGAVAACRARGLVVSPLGAYYAGPPRMTGLIMGFAGTPAALAADTARRLEGALRGGNGK